MMPCVEGDTSDCQPKANSIARSWFPVNILITLLNNSLFILFGICFIESHIPLSFSFNFIHLKFFKAAAFILSLSCTHARCRRRLLNPDRLMVSLVGQVSHTSNQYMDFFETFNISLDLSTINFAYFSGCWASVLYGCHSILECYNLFSGVEYKTVLFYYPDKEIQEPSGTESYSKNFYKFSSKSDLHN